MALKIKTAVIWVLSLSSLFSEWLAICACFDYIYVFLFFQCKRRICFGHGVSSFSHPCRSSQLNCEYATILSCVVYYFFTCCHLFCIVFFFFFFRLKPHKIWETFGWRAMAPLPRVEDWKYSTETMGGELWIISRWMKTLRTSLAISSDT